MVQYICFWSTFGIAPRFPFEIFAFGGASDDLLVWARSDRS